MKWLFKHNNHDHNHHDHNNHGHLSIMTMVTAMVPGLFRSSSQLQGEDSE